MDLPQCAPVPLPDLPGHGPLSLSVGPILTHADQALQQHIHTAPARDGRGFFCPSMPHERIPLDNKTFLTLFEDNSAAVRTSGRLLPFALHLDPARPQRAIDQAHALIPTFEDIARQPWACAQNGPASLANLSTSIFPFWLSCASLHLDNKMHIGLKRLSNILESACPSRPETLLLLAYSATISPTGHILPMVVRAENAVHGHQDIAMQGLLDLLCVEHLFGPQALCVGQRVHLGHQRMMHRYISTHILDLHPSRRPTQNAHDRLRAGRALREMAKPTTTSQSLAHALHASTGTYP